MLYLFILESIGTSELVLIAFIALIVFGPRKLPQMARTIGKAMSEFRRSTDDFKRTWEKEVKFEDIENGTEENSKLLLMLRAPKRSLFLKPRFLPFRSPFQI